MNRIKFLSKIALAASVSLALAFTFSCSSDDGEESGSPVTGGDDGGGNKNPQIYYDDSYWDDDDVHHYRVGAPYTGNGIIEIASSIGCGSPYNGGCGWDGLKAGSVTNGIVNLELPKNIPEEYLEGVEEGSCLALAFKDIKVFRGIFVLTNSNKEYLGELYLRYRDEQIYEQILYWYFSKDVNVKMTCDNIEYDIDAKAGWNKIYHNRRATPRKLTTKNILTKEMKWMYYNDLDD